MLTPADTEHFKQRLEAQREDLQQRITSLQGDVAAYEQDDEALDSGDEAALLRGHDEAWEQLAYVRDELTRVEKALVRIEAGTYGISEVSGAPIPLERLEAEPSTTTLVSETPPQ
jgi:DnaK suppressor protein